MAKLTKKEAERKTINVTVEVQNYSTLKYLIDLYGLDAKVYAESCGYDDCDLMITLSRQETDEEYYDRTEGILKLKKTLEKQKEEEKKKQKDIEYQTYLKLKEKFEGKE